MYNGTTSTTLATAKAAPAEALVEAFSFTALGVRDQPAAAGGQQQQDASASSSVVLATFDEDGAAAIAQQQLGAGSWVHYSFLPGISYAYQRRPFGPEGLALGRVLANITNLASGVCPPVVLTAPRVEAPLMLTPAKNAAVLTLLNWRCTENHCTAADTKVEKLGVKVRLPFVATTIRSTIANGATIAPTECPAADRCDDNQQAAAMEGQHVVCFEVNLVFGDILTIV
jgi:hypothetical protein